MSEQLLRFEGGYQHFFSERWGISAGAERALDSGGTLGFQLGYGLIVNDYGMDTENREITLDASYGFAPDPDGRNISIRVEYRSFQMKINENQVSSSTVTLGAGYHW